MLWTSGSFGSRASSEVSSGGVSLTGLVRFGSSPALVALRMRRAWYFAYLVLDVISGSSFFHIESMSRNAEAARRVSAVLLIFSQCTILKRTMSTRTWWPCCRSCRGRLLRKSAERTARSMRSRRCRQVWHLRLDVVPLLPRASP
jgi:hypothetical protein